MSNHAWCSDIPRDEAVRAAEDGRQGPLPTLEECISRAGQFATPEAPQGAKCTERESGLRTERVTLEVTHDLDAPLGDWLVQLLDETRGYDESVRVVEECCLDRINMGEVIRQRDAAIRERDEAKARLSLGLAGIDTIWSRLLAVGGERDSWKILAEKSNARADSLTARVAELESAPPARGWLTEEERKAVALAADEAPESDFVTSDEGEWIKETLTALLARSTPPEVVLPPAAKGETPLVRDLMWGQAIRAAGVTVKEVGRE